MSSPRRDPIESYSGLFSTTADIYRPRNEKELQSVFATAERNGQRVTIRCGGHAFHDQSLGDQLVISMEHFRKIVIGPGARVTAGAGARWGKIVRRLKRKGFVPYGTVTSSRATPGGTLAADCLNRFSPTFGKEAEHVLCFRMMTIDGSCKYYYPPRDPNAPGTWAEDEKIFMAVVGGFGYLGAVLEITYAVRACGSRRLAVRTEVEKLDSFANLEASLIPSTTATWGTVRGVKAPCDGSRWEAISAGLYPAGGGQPTAIVFKSKLVKTCKRWPPYLLHHPYNPVVILAQWGMRWPWLCRCLSQLFYDRTTDGATYTDGLFGYLFMMDANWIARALARLVAIDLKTVQQTFFVPANQLADWLDQAHTELTKRKLTPTITDVLYLPADLAFCLSPNARTPGFAVSYAFETNTTAPAIAALEYLAEILSKPPFSARVSLVKNVCVEKSTLYAMYGPQARDFLALKKKLDPRDLLRNTFFDRVLTP